MTASLKQSCIVQYKLDDCARTTTVIDSRGFSNGISVRNTQFMAAAGPFAAALALDGAADYVDTGHAFNALLARSFSLSIWCKPNDGRPAAYQFICGVQKEISGSPGVPVYYAGFGLRIESTGKLTAAYVSGEDDFGVRTDNAVFADGLETWHHIVMTVDIVSATEVNILLYFDGELLPVSILGSGAITKDYVSDYSLYIGAEHNLSGDPLYFFNGALANVCLFDRVLTTAEITSLLTTDVLTDSITETAVVLEGDSAVQDMLQTGETYLAAQIRKHAGSQVTYTQGLNRFICIATAGQSDYAVKDDAGIEVGGAMADFLIDKRYLVAYATQFEPKQGDTLVTDTGTFEVVYFGSEGCWRWSGRFSNTYRIHTRRIA